MSVFTYVHTYIHTSICLYVRTYICTRAHTNAYEHTYPHIRTCLFYCLCGRLCGNMTVKARGWTVAVYLLFPVLSVKSLCCLHKVGATFKFYAELTFWIPMFPYRNVHRKTPIEIHFKYLCNNEICCIFKTCCSIKCHLLYNFILFFSNNVFVINGALTFKSPPQ